MPWRLQMSTITPEQRAKLILFISGAHSGHGAYVILERFPVTECCVAGDAVPRSADCSSRSAQIFSNDETSSHKPEQSSHSRTFVDPIVTDCMSILQRGHFLASSCASERLAADAPQR